jgi:hypothetical protein
VTEDCRDGGDQLEPRELGAADRDDVPDDQDGDQPLEEIAREGNRGGTTPQRPQDIGRAGAPATVGRQIDVSVNAGDDDAGRN